MPRRPLWALLALALSAHLLPSAGEAQGAATGTLDARLDGIFAPWSKTDTPGCAIAAGRHGAPLAIRAYGMADLERDVPNATTTIFEAGSVSKQFTAAAVVLLAHDGKLSLDDDVRKHIPELPDYGETITIRHMLNHTSGLRDWGTVSAAAGWPRGTRVYTHAHVLDIAARQRSLNFPPGGEYLYSNTGYNLATIIVERVSGIPFAEFTRRRLFEPLGMTSTSWRDDFTRVVKGRALAYERDRDGVWRMEMPFENGHGNGGLLTTVGDLMKWNRIFADSASAFRRLAHDLEQRGRLRNGSLIHYALGLSVDSLRGVPEISHSGATAGYRAFMARYPDQGVEIALLCNAGDANGNRLARQVAEAVLGSSLGPVQDASATASGAPRDRDAHARAGLYRSLRDGTTLTLVAGDGVLRISEGPVLTPLGAAAYRVGTSDVRVVFTTAANGRTRELLWPTREGDTSRYVPVMPWSPTAAELAPLAGEYRSDEVDVTYRIAVANGKVTVRAGPAMSVELTPVYTDVFRSDVGLVRFLRDGRGRITGLSLGLQRARDLRFVKTR